jgi:hypothetical protein
MIIPDKDKEKIKKNLDAYLENFEPIIIKKYNKQFYVYPEGREEYVQFCENIDYLNGWLYGAVQAKCKMIKAK